MQKYLIFILAYKENNFWMNIHICYTSMLDNFTLNTLLLGFLFVYLFRDKGLPSILNQLVTHCVEQTGHELTDLHIVDLD